MTIEKIQMQGYTRDEAELIALVQQHAEQDEDFGKRYRHGQYSLADIVQILAPQVTTEKQHRFEVTVTGCSREQAEQVMAERLSHDENYGFDYEIGWQ